MDALVTPKKSKKIRKYEYDVIRVREGTGEGLRTGVDGEAKIGKGGDEG